MWSGSTITNLGDGMRLAALPLLAASLTDSPVLISGVMAAIFLPWLLFAPIGGAFVDRWRRRETVVTTQLWRAVVMFGLAALVVSDLVVIWHVYVTALLITAGEILVDPAIGAMIPTVVAPDDLDDANGALSATEIVTNEFIGAPVGGLAFALRSWLPFAADGVSYAVSVLAFRRLPRSPVTPASQRAALRDDVVEGMRWLRRHPVLWPMTLLTALFHIGAIMAWSVLVILVLDVLGASEAAFGFLLATAAAAGLIGSLLAARVVARLGRSRVFAGAFVIEGALLVVVGLAPNLTVLFVAWFVLGVPAGVWMPTARAMQQRMAPNRLLGRVNVASRIVSRGAMVFAAVAGGVVASLTSVRAAIVVGGLVQLVAGLMVARVMRGRNLDAVAAPSAD